MNNRLLRIRNRWYKSIDQLREILNNITPDSPLFEEVLKNLKDARLANWLSCIGENVISQKVANLPTSLNSSELMEKLVQVILGKKIELPPISPLYYAELKSVYYDNDKKFEKLHDTFVIQDDHLRINSDKLRLVFSVKRSENTTFHLEAKIRHEDSDEYLVQSGYDLCLNNKSVDDEVAIEVIVPLLILDRSNPYRMDIVHENEKIASIKVVLSHSNESSEKTEVVSLPQTGNKSLTLEERLELTAKKYRENTGVRTTISTAFNRSDVGSIVDAVSNNKSLTLEERLELTAKKYRENTGVRTTISTAFKRSDIGSNVDAVSNHIKNRTELDCNVFRVGKVIFKMINVEGGVFQMGATKEQGEDASKHETPVHSVRVNSFSLAETVVTQDLWFAVMGTNPSLYKGAQHPVTNISYRDCKKFIMQLNSITGKHFRLPTEEEWEYAAKGGRKGSPYKYCGSDNLDEVAWYWENSGDVTHDVASKKPNEMGVYDMSGNVWEWCSSDYREYTGTTKAKDLNSKVTRGGCATSMSNGCRTSRRYKCKQDHKTCYLGFRLAL